MRNYLRFLSSYGIFAQASLVCDGLRRMLRPFSFGRFLFYAAIYYSRSCQPATHHPGLSPSNLLSNNTSSKVLSYKNLNFQLPKVHLPSIYPPAKHQPEFRLLVTNIHRPTIQCLLIPQPRHIAQRNSGFMIQRYVHVNESR